jgi:hypothetical protein
VEKKKFVPNLNVTRNIKKEAEQQPAKEEKSGGGKRGKKENKQHEKRDNKHHKDRPALIQTLGSVFADGEIMSGSFLRSQLNTGIFFVFFSFVCHWPVGSRYYYSFRKRVLFSATSFL